MSGYLVAQRHDRVRVLETGREGVVLASRTRRQGNSVTARDCFVLMDSGDRVWVHADNLEVLADA